jgi:hypothetical protein
LSSVEKFIFSPFSDGIVRNIKFPSQIFDLSIIGEHNGIEGKEYPNLKRIRYYDTKIEKIPEDIDEIEFDCCEVILENINERKQNVRFWECVIYLDYLTVMETFGKSCSADTQTKIFNIKIYKDGVAIDTKRKESFYNIRIPSCEYFERMSPAQRFDFFNSNEPNKRRISVLNLRDRMIGLEDMNRKREAKGLKSFHEVIHKRNLRFAPIDDLSIPSSQFFNETEPPEKIERYLSCLGLERYKKLSKYSYELEFYQDERDIILGLKPEKQKMKRLPNNPHILLGEEMEILRDNRYSSEHFFNNDLPRYAMSGYLMFLGHNPSSFVSASISQIATCGSTYRNRILQI